MPAVLVAFVLMDPLCSVVYCFTVASTLLVSLFLCGFPKGQCRPERSLVLCEEESHLAR